MKSADADILIVPGWSGSGPDHWQSRWEEKLSTARRIDQADWYKLHREDWAGRIAAAVREATRPAVLVAHSAGAIAVAHAAAELAPWVRGAFLVAPPSDKALRAIPNTDPAFAPAPRTRLPFPSVVVASRSDPYCPFDEAEALARDWGAAFTDAGEAGHINAASGHGPWPEGLMRFAGFMRSL